MGDRRAIEDLIFETVNGAKYNIFRDIKIQNIFNDRFWKIYKIKYVFWYTCK